MYEALLVVFLIVAIALVGMIMLQQGKGADMGGSVLHHQPGSG
jgi:preprotein translocase subunit SecG